MRALDGQEQRGLRSVQLYLSRGEAAELREALDRLLGDPEANEHVHVMSSDAVAELSVSIVTAHKLRSGGRYTRTEQELLRNAPV